MINKFFSIITFIFIAFSIFTLMYLVQNSNQIYDIKYLDKMVEKEIQEIKHLKRKHIDTH